MIVLGIETATTICGVSITADDGLAIEYKINKPRIHSEKIAEITQTLLNEANISSKDLSAVAVSIGPGSFTGLRIGLSFAKGISYAGNTPLIPISTLKALAAPFKGYDQLICPIIDARKNELYTACYRWKNNTFIQLKEVCAITPEALVSLTSEPTIFTGDGVNLYESFLKENLGENAQFAAPELQIVSPMTIARLGMDKFKSGNFESSDDIEPVYIRNFVPNVKT